MRISQLATASEVPVATIKYYLREKLLHDGRLTSATQAQYDDTHVARLRLIRALLGPGRLSVAATRDLLGHLDHPPASPHDLLGAAQGAVTPTAADDVDLRRVHELLERWDWQIDIKDVDSQAMLAQALDALDQAGFELPEGALDLYARTMADIAALEIASVPATSQADAVRYVVLGAVLVEPILLALRRLAEQDASARRFAPNER